MLLSCLLSPPELRSRRNLRPWSGIPALISKYRLLDLTRCPPLTCRTLPLPGFLLSSLKHARRSSAVRGAIHRPSLESPCRRCRLRVVAPAVTVKQKKVNTFLTDVEAAGTSSIAEEERTL
ncbi:hypothetical protein CapIbe_012437 [Capra ibex]